MVWLISVGLGGGFANNVLNQNSLQSLLRQVHWRSFSRHSIKVCLLVCHLIKEILLFTVKHLSQQYKYPQHHEQIPILVNLLQHSTFKISYEKDQAVYLTYHCRSFNYLLIFSHTPLSARRWTGGSHRSSGSILGPRVTLMSQLYLNLLPLITQFLILRIMR